MTDMAKKTKGRASIIRQMASHLDDLNARIDEYEKYGTMGRKRPTVFHVVNGRLVRDESNK